MTSTGPTGGPPAPGTPSTGGPAGPRPARPERIDQALHILAAHDAIGTHVLALRDVLHEAGYESDIYVGAAHLEVSRFTTPIGELAGRHRRQRPWTRPPTGTDPTGTGTPETADGRPWLLFHHSTGSAVVDDVLAVVDAGTPLLLDYHNVTPAALVERFAPEVRDELVTGAAQLHALAPRARTVVAHSRFSARELADAGADPARTTVLPVLFDPAQFEADPDPAVLSRLRPTDDVPPTFLFVGRLSPHKAQHDLVAALAVYRRLFEPGARLCLVGTSLGADYPRALARYADRLGLADAVEMPGTVSPAALAAYYRASDVFVCASDHEGFCVPLVEAMHAGLPVVAYDAAAVAETVGAGGLVVRDKSPVALACALARVVGDPRVRERLRAAGRRRAAELSLEAGRKAWTAALAEATGGAP